MEKILTITKNNYNELKKLVDLYVPYNDDDVEYKKYDGKCDKNRLKATTAKRILDDIENHPEKYRIE